MLDDLTTTVNRLSEQSTELCYHCHKCTAGCPVVSEMTFGPDRVLRMVAWGRSSRCSTARISGCALAV